MIIPILGLCATLLFQDSVDTYGKSEAEILKMGQSGWYDFYTSKAGDSTAGMSNAYGIYADVASKRNDLLIAKLPSSKRQKIAGLRKMLTTFGGQMTDLGSEMTGGGTMWNPITAQVYASAQDTIYAVIHPEGQTKPKHRVVSQAIVSLDKFVPKLKKEAVDGFITKEQVKKAPADIASAKSLYRKIVKLAASFDRETSDRILGFCLDQAQLPISIGN